MSIYQPKSSEREFIGTDADDRLIGTDGDDLFIGGKGNDYLEGKKGNDTYIFSKGDGQDIIYDSDKNGGSINTIKFTDVRSDEVEFRGEDSDLIIEYGNGDSIRVKQFFWEAFASDNYKIERFEFIDKTLDLSDLKKIEIKVDLVESTRLENFPWQGKLNIIGHENKKNVINASTGDVGQIITGGNEGDVITSSKGDDIIHAGAGDDEVRIAGGNNEVHGGAGNDKIYTGVGDDLIIGGTGNDYLEGGRGNDTYVFSKGDGHDVVRDSEGSEGFINTFKFTDIRSDEVQFRGENWDLILENNYGDSIRIENFFYRSFSSDNYKIQLFEFSDRVMTLDDLKQVDTTINIVGQNTLNNFPWEGKLTIIGNQNSENTINVNTGAVGQTIKGGDAGNTISGSKGNDSIYGGKGDDILEAGQGDDYLEGRAGNNTYIFYQKDGQDVVNNYSETGDAESDKAIFVNVSYKTSQFIQNGDDLIIKYGSNDAVTIKSHFLGGKYQIDHFEFSDGNLTKEEIDDLAVEGPGLNKPPSLTGELEAININERDNFTLTLPQDLFTDPEGKTLTYTVTLANGGKLPSWLSFNPDTLTLSGTPGNYDVAKLVLKIIATDPEGLSSSYPLDMTIHNINDAPEANGTLKDQTANINTEWVYTLPQDSFTDIDIIHGDVLTYSVKMKDNSAVPQWLVINPITGAISGTPNQLGNYDIVIVATDKEGLSAEHSLSITVTDKDGGGEPTPPEPEPEGKEIIIYKGTEFGRGTAGNDIIRSHEDRVGGYIHAGAGNDTIYGNDSNDSLYGESGDNTLIGGKGDDFLSGGSGNNLYIFNKGDGNDTVFVTKNSALDTTDVIKFTDVKSTEATFRGEDLDLIVDYNNGDSIRIRGFFQQSGRQMIDRFEFSDKTLTLKDLERMSLTLKVSDGTKNPLLNLNWNGRLTIQGSNADNRIMLGGNKNNRVNAGAGNDYIKGSDGDDYLVGGKGDDYLMGGLGSDTYVFSKGDGKDTINNYSYSRAPRLEKDIVEFTDVRADEAKFSQIEKNLVITYGQNDSIVIQNYFVGEHYRIHEIHFTDRVMDSSDIVSQIPKMSPSFNLTDINITVEQELHQILDGMAIFGQSNDGVSTSSLIDIGTRADALSSHFTSSSLL